MNFLANTSARYEIPIWCNFVNDYIAFLILHLFHNCLARFLSRILEPNYFCKNNFLAANCEKLRDCEREQNISAVVKNAKHDVNNRDSFPRNSIFFRIIYLN